MCELKTNERSVQSTAKRMDPTSFVWLLFGGYSLKSEWKGAQHGFLRMICQRKTISADFRRLATFRSGINLIRRMQKSSTVANFWFPDGDIQPTVKGFLLCKKSKPPESVGKPGGSTEAQQKLQTLIDALWAGMPQTLGSYDFEHDWYVSTVTESLSQKVQSGDDQNGEGGAAAAAASTTSKSIDQTAALKNMIQVYADAWASTIPIRSLEGLDASDANSVGTTLLKHMYDTVKNILQSSTSDYRTVLLQAHARIMSTYHCTPAVLTCPPIPLSSKSFTEEVGGTSFNYTVLLDEDRISSDTFALVFTTYGSSSNLQTIVQEWLSGSDVVGSDVATRLRRNNMPVTMSHVRTKPVSKSSGPRKRTIQMVATNGDDETRQLLVTRDTI
jgi:hypothetical protein